MLSLHRQPQKITIPITMVVVLLLSTAFAFGINENIQKHMYEHRSRIHSTFPWYGFNLKRNAVNLETSYSSKQSNQFTFINHNPIKIVINKIYLIISERIRHYLLKPLQIAHSNIVNEIDITNRVTYPVNIMTLSQQLEHPSTILNPIKIDNITTHSKINITRRYRRDDQNACSKFEEGDMMKKEFYSPEYPDPYPKNINCFKVLEADPGMVLKVEFRDNFELEDQEKCTYDFLEVRDGKYGYSRLIGRFCRAFPFPEITSSSRFLWLYFHSDSSIEGNGFRAVWNMIPRPPVKTPESEECVLNVTNLLEYEIRTSEIAAQKKTAAELGTELDCVWNITVPDGWKIQMTFPKFHLDKPNECDINYVQFYDKEPSMINNPTLINNFCGSIADLVLSKGNEAYLRFFVTKAAMNSSFEAIMTAVREKESKDKGCNDDEFDCQDACISDELRCNNRPNCRYRFDEDADVCNTKSTGLNVNSEHVIIILVVFTLLMSGLCFTFVFNCMKKLIRDHRIIKEHIRQSRENRLDELGRKAAPCSMIDSCNEIENNDHHHSSESTSLEVLTNPKELVTPLTILDRDYGKECSMKLSIDLSDIHQSNNVSNATQERLQESSDERKTRDTECQTRESLFNSDPFYKPSTYFAHTTSGLKMKTCSCKPSLDYLPSKHYNHHVLPRQHSQLHNYCHDINQQFKENKINSFSNENDQIRVSECCSEYRPSDDLSSILSLNHSSTSIVPAPPGWSTHESTYNYNDFINLQQISTGTSENRSKEELHSDSIRNTFSPKFNTGKKIVGSGENYGFIYGNYDREFNAYSTSTGTNSQKSDIVNPVKYSQVLDSRFKTEAIIEVDQKRPFSIESTKSAPDVIATH